MRPTRIPIVALVIAASWLVTPSLVLAEDDVQDIESASEIDDIEAVSADDPVVADEKTGKHCLGKQATRVTLRQHIAAQYNATGLEHHMRLGVCTPLIETPGMLFDLTHVEAGVLSYLTPAYFQTGGYLEIIPIAPLVFRAELSAVNYLPLRAFRRAGYVERSGYDDEFDNDLIDKSGARAASGFNFNAIAIPRIRVGFGENFGIVALSQLAFEYWNVGQRPYYVNLRRDVIAAESDSFFTAETIVLFEWLATEYLKVRVGAFDSFRTVLGSGYEANQVGGMAMVNWPQPFDTTYDLSIFVRAGVYTDHAFRELEPSVLGGMFVSHAWLDLSASSD